MKGPVSYQVASIFLSCVDLSICVISLIYSAANDAANRNCLTMPQMLHQNLIRKQCADLELHMLEHKLFLELKMVHVPRPGHNCFIDHNF